MRRLFVPLALVASLSAAAPAPTADATRAALLVSPSWLAAHLDDPDLVLLHVGERAEYERAHIPGARYTSFDDISAPRQPGGLILELPDAATLLANLAALGISDDSRIVVYYGEDWVSPATRLLFTLDVAGLGDRTSLLDGGMRSWLRENHPVTAELPQPRPGKLSPRALRPLVVDAAFVLEHVQTPGYAIVDARNAAYFNGERSGGSSDAPQRRGHISGALSVPYNEVMDEELRLRSPEELEALFARAGVQPGDTIVTYCHIGQQATATLFAARSLGYSVLLYDGSFQDWSSRGYPVDDPAAPAGP